MPFAEMKPVRVNTFELEAVENLTPALTWTRSFGFYGMINLNQDGEWLLSITRAGEEQSVGRVDARLGQVLVWDGVRLSVYDREAFHEIYNIADPE